MGRSILELEAPMTDWDQHDWRTQPEQGGPTPRYRTVATAVGLFAGTNIDDIIVLTRARRGDPAVGSGTLSP